jgi:adenosylmethionine-8-amino-7-oxononanoate aminotransferase
MSDRYIFNAIMHKGLPKIVKGEGIYLYDEEGKRYLDGSAGPMCVSLGHCIPEIADEMYEQAKKLCFTYRIQFYNDPMEKLGEKLAQWAPGNLNRAFFVNSGSEASEMVLKLARNYWLEKGKPSKTMIISRWSSYHGSTMGALSMSGHVARRKEYFPYLHIFPQVVPPYCYQCPLKKTYPECDCACARQLEDAINRLGAKNISAFIAEPIVAAAAAGVYGPPEYYKIIREICDEYEVLFIADEVVTGCGRTGETFAMKHWDVVPDIITFGKGISSGFTPLAGFIAGDHIYDAINEGSGLFLTGHTFAGNPLSTAVGYSVLTYMEKHNLIEAAKEKGKYLEKKLRELMDKYEIIGDVRGKGLMWGIEFVEDRKTHKPFDASKNVTGRMVGYSKGNGLVVFASQGTINGVAGDAILITPPMIITLEQIDELVELLEKSIVQLIEKLKTL